MTFQQKYQGWPPEKAGRRQYMPPALQPRLQMPKPLTSSPMPTPSPPPAPSTPPQSTPRPQVTAVRLRVYVTRIPAAGSTSFLTRSLRLVRYRPNKKCIVFRVDHDWLGGANDPPSGVEIRSRRSQKGPKADAASRAAKRNRRGVAEFLWQRALGFF